MNLQDAFSLYQSNPSLMSDCIKTYGQELLYRNVYGQKKSYVKKCNLIDIRDLFPDRKKGIFLPFTSVGSADGIMPDTKLSFYQTVGADVVADINQFMRKQGWYSLIPCFQEGTLWLNDGRYLHFKLDELKPYENTYTVTLFDYMWQPKTLWQPGNSATYRIQFSKDEQGVTQDVTVSNFKDFPEIYTMLDPHDDLHWDNAHKKAWNIILRHSIESTNGLKNNNVNKEDELLYIFETIIPYINYLLEKEKRVTRNKTRTKVTTKVGDIVETKDRIVREYGVVKISSDKVPKVPTEAVLRTYKVASWPVRAFPRHYKNGTVGYIKEQTRNRKALKNLAKNTETQPVTMKFKNKKQDDDDSDE